MGTYDKTDNANLANVLIMPKNKRGYIFRQARMKFTLMNPKEPRLHPSSKTKF